MRSWLAVVLASIWIGAALLLAGSVTPALFATLPSREMAGAVVAVVLPVVFICGLAGGLLVGGAELQRGPSALSRAQVGCAVVWASACGVAQFVLIPRIQQLRQAIAGPIDALSRDDSRRVAFGRLHGGVVGLFGIAIVAAAGVVVLAIAAGRYRPAHS